MKRLAMASVLAVAGAAALAVPARADVHVSGGVVITAHDDRGYRGDWRGVGSAFRYGYDRGWREGSDEGSHDGRRRSDPRYWREGEFRDGGRGYRGWMGPRPEYARGFREGYQSGYRRAYAAARPGWYSGRPTPGRYDPYYRGDRRDDPYYRGDGRYDPYDRNDERHRRDDDYRR